MDLVALQPFAEKLFEDIRALSFDGVGVTRDSYGAGETAAADYLRKFAEDERLAVESDRAANLHFRLPQTTPGTPVAWVGSHLDSVPQGGNFDGLAGIVAGLLCLIDRRDRTSTASPLPLNVVAFRGEESAWFGKAYMGSGALLGKLGAADLSLARRATSETLAQCMSRCGADTDAIRQQEPLIDLGAVKAYLELHIEQGPVMVARDLPLAVVSGIRGNVRHNRVVCVGDAQHSGVVPRWLRHDSMFAVADLIMRIDEHWKVLLERGTDLVVTTGVVNTDPAEHSISRIPGQVAFSLEVRSRSADTLEAFYQVVRAECKAIERERGVRFEFDRRLFSDPATMAPAISEQLARACRTHAIAHDTIPSGAGHDASLFANAGVPTGMLFVRNRTGSHNPNEAMDIDDFMLGVQALGTALDHLT